MSRAIWNGSISFGLVSIPVSLHPAEASENELHFRMLDRKNLSPIQYKKINQKTGQEVPYERIVKGYEYEKDQFVVMTDEDFKRANVEATQTISIQEFVSRDEIHSTFFETPYYLAPDGKPAQRAYALFREVLKKSGKVAIARVVIRQKEHLVALLVDGPVVLMETLRFGYQIRDVEDLKLPPLDLKKLRISVKETEMANRLVKEMSGKWKPDAYKDDYHDDLLALIEKKAKSGKLESIPDEKVKTSKPRVPKDLMALLQESVSKAHKPGRRGRIHYAS